MLSGDVKRHVYLAEDRNAKLCPQASEFSPSLLEATPEKKLCVESDTGHNIASATRAARADSTVLQCDDLCGGVSCQRARQAQCT